MGNEDERSEDYEDENFIIGDKEYFASKDEDRSDEAYEQYRDNAGDYLDNDLKEVIRKHYRKQGYYHKHFAKLKAHAIIGLEMLTEEQIK